VRKLTEARAQAARVKRAEAEAAVAATANAAAVASSAAGDALFGAEDPEQMEEAAPSLSSPAVVATTARTAPAATAGPITRRQTMPSQRSKPKWNVSGAAAAIPTVTLQTPRAARAAAGAMAPCMRRTTLASSRGLMPKDAAADKVADTAVGRMPREIKSVNVSLVRDGAAVPKENAPPPAKEVPSKENPKPRGLGATAATAASSAKAALAVSVPKMLKTASTSTTTVAEVAVAGKAVERI